MTTDQRFLIVVPARLSSSRFPRKLLARVGGLPVLLHTLSRLSRCDGIARVVATDSAEILALCHRHDYPCIDTPSGCRNGTERCAYVGTLYPEHEWIINVQADEIFVCAQDIVSIARIIVEEPDVIVSLRSSRPTTSHLYNDVKVVIDQDDYAVDFFRESPRSEAYHHHGIYAYHQSLLRDISLLPPSVRELERSLEQMRWLDAGYRIKMLPSDVPTVSINSPEDIIRAQSILEQKRVST